MTHPTTRETDMQSIEKLQYEANLYTTHPTPARQACAEALDILEACKAALTEAREWIGGYGWERAEKVAKIDATIARMG
jgi:hypothetical protein